MQTITVAGGNAEALLSALSKIESMIESRSPDGGALGQMRVCFEAGYDGFGRRASPDQSTLCSGFPALLGD